MPAADDDTVKPSWADQVEEQEGTDLPPPREDFNPKTGVKTVTEYKYNDDDKKVKVIRQYRIEKRTVSKSVANRKTWKKFGASQNDKPGPNKNTTVVGDDIQMEFISQKDHDADARGEEDAMDALRRENAAKGLVVCRMCKGDHWTQKCPYKDQLAPIQEATKAGPATSATTEAGGAADAAGSRGAAAVESKSGKYVPPNMREGAGARRGESMTTGRRDESTTIRVTNLSEDTRDSDLQELFRPFGAISRIYLAKDKQTGQSKGFAFITFHKRDDAARAIRGVSGYGYDHLILNVEWAKPSNN